MTANGKIHIVCPLPEKPYTRASLSREIDLSSVSIRAIVFEGQESTGYTKWEALERDTAFARGRMNNRKGHRSNYHAFAFSYLFGLGPRLQVAWFGVLRFQ